MKKTNMKISETANNAEAAVIVDALNSMSESEVLDMLLDDIIDEKMPDEIVLEAGHAIESEVEAAVAAIEMTEAVRAMYAEDDADNAEVAEADKPKTEPAAIEAPKAGKKGKKADAVPKAPRVTSIGHKRSEVLNARLGGKANEFLVLEV